MTRRHKREVFLGGDDTPTFARHTSAQRVLDRTDAAQWLDSRIPGGLASPLARLLANAYTEELGADLAEISAVTVVDLLRDSPRDRVSPYEESDQRYHVRGGNDLIVQRMAEALAGRIETGTRLVAVERRGDGRYRLAFARDLAMREAEFDHVVLAVPFTLLRDVDLARAGFRPRKLLAIRELGMGRNTKLQLQFDERAWIARGGSGETRIEGSYQKRISREIHDDASQSLLLLIHRLDAVLSDPGDKLSKTVREKLSRLYSLAVEILDGLRHYAQELRPAILDHVGLSQLRWYGWLRA